MSPVLDGSGGGREDDYLILFSLSGLTFYARQA